MILRALVVIFLCLPAVSAAEDRLVRLHAPQALVETGLLKHALPRFSLKTQVRVALTDLGSADIVLGETGRALFQGPSQTWNMEVRRADHPGTQRLAEWLESEVGQRTITSFAPDGGAPLFAPPAAVEEAEEDLLFDADAELGHAVSRAKCTRCHAVDAATAGWGIGSTPSFAVLRAMPDWVDRFSAFYILNPHPAFTQITNLTPPFPIDRPSPIAPIELTLDEVEAVLAYVAAMEAADLGQPLAHQ